MAADQVLRMMISVNQDVEGLHDTNTTAFMCISKDVAESLELKAEEL